MKSKLINFLFPSIERTRDHEEINALFSKAKEISVKAHKGHLEFLRRHKGGASVEELEDRNREHDLLIAEHAVVTAEHSKLVNAWRKKYLS